MFKLSLKNCNSYYLFTFHDIAETETFFFTADMPTKKKQSITFSIFAPAASSVSVAGSFNEWDEEKHPMRKKKDGTWTKRVSLPPGRHEYQFVINGEIWECDKNSEKYCPNTFGGMNSVLALE